MGFDVKQEAVLDFAGRAEFDGLEVVVNLDFTIDEFYDIQAQMPTQAQFDEAANNAETLELVRQSFVVFGDQVLESWNLERRGEVVAATGEGMRAQVPLRLANAIIGAWSKAMTDVQEVPDDSPLPGASPNGASEAGADVPMAPA